MGFLRRNIENGRRFQMKEKLISIGDDAWIEDNQGERVCKVDHKAMRIRGYVHPRGPQPRRGREDPGEEAQRPQQDADRARRQQVATVNKALMGSRDRFHVEMEDGEDLKAHGNVVDHEYRSSATGM